jgi:Antirestriction protein
MSDFSPNPHISLVARSARLDQHSFIKAFVVPSGTMHKSAIIAKRVGPAMRLDILPKYFGARLMLTVERTVYDVLSELAADYCGGYWHFYELSNGGFYMAPDLQPRRICVAGNNYDDVLSADAAGIVACLFTYSRLSSAYASEVLAEQYYCLRDFAMGHAEASKILRAVD